MDLVIKYRIAEAARQREFQSALALGHDIFDAMQSGWRAYSFVVGLTD